MEEKRTDYLGMQTGTATLEDSVAVFTQLNIVLPYDLILMIFGNYPN